MFEFACGFGLTLLLLVLPSCCVFALPEQRWNVTLTNGMFTSQLLVDEISGLVAAETTDGLFAYSAATGAELWRTSQCISNIATWRTGTTERMDYFVAYDSNASAVVALNKSTGLVSWSAPVGAEQSNSTAAAMDIAVTGGTVIYCSPLRQVLSALSLSDGSSLWNSSTAVRCTAGSVLVPAADPFFLIVIASTGDILWYVSVRTGAIMWRKVFPHPISDWISAPGEGILVADMNVAIDTPSIFVAMSTRSGETLWSLPHGFAAIDVPVISPNNSLVMPMFAHSGASGISEFRSIFWFLEPQSGAFQGYTEHYFNPSISAPVFLGDDSVTVDAVYPFGFCLYQNLSTNIGCGLMDEFELSRPLLVDGGKAIVFVTSQESPSQVLAWYDVIDQ